MNIKVLLVDDHDIVRKGLRAYLDTQSDIHVIAEARTGEEAITLVGLRNPDVILMDITMEGMNGLDATRQIKMRSPDCKILALTVHSDKQHFFNMLSAGAEGYVTKQAAVEDLLDAIRAVAAGQVYLQPALARWLLEDYRRLSDESSAELSFNQSSEKAKRGLENLTDRERQVLELVSDGKNNKEIGELLGISHKTVARHRERIMRKLDMHSCAELVRFAIRTGLIDANS